jgi:hypothetical protein
MLQCRAAAGRTLCHSCLPVRRRLPCRRQLLFMPLHPRRHVSTGWQGGTARQQPACRASHKTVSTCVCMYFSGLLTLTCNSCCELHMLRRNISFKSIPCSVPSLRLEPAATSLVSVFSPCTQLGLQLKHGEGHHTPRQAYEGKPWAVI